MGAAWAVAGQWVGVPCTGKLGQQVCVHCVQCFTERFKGKGGWLRTRAFATHAPACARRRMVKGAVPIWHGLTMQQPHPEKAV